MDIKKELEVKIEAEIKAVIKHLQASVDLLYRYDDIIDNADNNRFYKDYQFCISYDELYLKFEAMISNK